MAVPTTINTIIASIVGMTTTSTTVIPPSGIVMVLTLGTPFPCDGVYVCSILVDGDSGDDNSVDQRKMEQRFH